MPQTKIKIGSWMNGEEALCRRRRRRRRSGEAECKAVPDVIPAHPPEKAEDHFQEYAQEGVNDKEPQD